MNFDDFKTAWNDEQAADIKVPATIEKLKTAHMPVEQLRRKMHGEFYVQVISVILIAFIPQLLNFSQSLYLPFYGMYAVFFSLCTYYLAKLIIFYKTLDVSTLSTKDSLYETYYNLKLNIEVYKSFTYSLSPFALIFGALVILNAGDGKLMKMIVEHGLKDTQVIWATTTFIVVMVSVTIITELYVSKQYGRYASQLKTLIDELKEV
ncbi:hypothetical protein N180_03610 [Pedobacter antarcticus 4BY]|uniref:Uncharacterized protein n=2 Tax=Pedobacter antarcticus TaxID=34086 RepID=A0A081PFI3_9SPHI|nr:hypothetical protein [Pedobacter antarcticus]KEQ29456.1 hypothetical protein N180_03610 [Pedobacter antarcticus 4BY]SFF11916.1 hypothetical protein SAMN03003324_02476 [Pedobacter antarcticus]